MKKTFYALSAVAIFGFSSCEKEDIENLFGFEVSNEIEHVTVRNSEYEVVPTTALQYNGDEITAGVLEYREDGEATTIIDFSNMNDGIAMKTCDGSNHDVDMHQKKRKKGRKSKFKKLVIEPIVKSDDCNYIIAGIIKFFKHDGTWVATIDFGDGTCDDIATKTTPEGVHEFTLKSFED